MASASQFQKLVSRNDDIARLVGKGYAVTFDSGWMIIRDIPYLDQQGAEQWGAIATKLVPVDATDLVQQEDHTILFAGTHPCGLDGVPIPLIDAGTHQLQLSAACADVVVQRRFSNKPRIAGALHGYQNFYEKIESYVGIVAGPAMERHGSNPLTYKAVEDIPEPSVFRYQDSLSSKAEIADLSAKLKDDVIAIIGLGGTGSSVLDYMVKTPVREIRGFDGDYFHVHNAYRSQGKLEEWELGQPKAVVYQGRYEGFRSGVQLYKQYVDSESGPALEGVTFAFVCVDKGPARGAIFDLLIGLGIPFIDVGMGLKRAGGALSGMLRTTYFCVEKAQQMRAMGLAEVSETPENIYRTNVQIAELNGLNAALAVIRYKQLRQFYTEATAQSHLLFDLSDLKMAGMTADEI
ncbi:MAG: ThiF family adenylyltransferase [Hydrogenophaga sp.]|uniref:ThiF family adenylyltransferase n=1 Tax=Hydrogenophaga sp. TaxID=1904254 RepID=UPI0016B0BD59|nr:ThiF family adenylyltransferase [Hydrogenophaga sp.]NIM40230.1 ThiF family adenylyltransferase [Hydrogenophaga sp.]NIN25461.1 ThiF family adenylyltransferase [Hydrogenophaga sp.]NIN30113.1 ThiF family adenylyltransferase [Hydrogenophaga sp.]NIN54414.1 ThiF family adenylyltransferase [Hydrogenophaga sp.]NIO50287.1 ThiF family adenylyltransferase [Hydrogenophaga sp.]